jgi:hypothetical protein
MKNFKDLAKYKERMISQRTLHRQGLHSPIMIAFFVLKPKLLDMIAYPFYSTEDKSGASQTAQNGTFVFITA